MKVTVLFMDGNMETFEGIVKVTNCSNNVPNDWICIYRIIDPPGQPSLRWPMSKVNCVEVLADGFVDNRF